MNVKCYLSIVLDGRHSALRQHIQSFAETGPGCRLRYLKVLADEELAYANFLQDLSS